MEKATGRSKRGSTKNVVVRWMLRRQEEAELLELARLLDKFYGPQLKEWLAMPDSIGRRTKGTT